MAHLLAGVEVEHSQSSGQRKALQQVCVGEAVGELKIQHLDVLGGGVLG